MIERLSRPAVARGFSLVGMSVFLVLAPGCSMMKATLAHLRPAPANAVAPAMLPVQPNCAAPQAVVSGVVSTAPAGPGMMGAGDPAVGFSAGQPQTIPPNTNVPSVPADQLGGLSQPATAESSVLAQQQLHMPAGTGPGAAATEQPLQMCPPVVPDVPLESTQLSECRQQVDQLTMQMRTMQQGTLMNARILTSLAAEQKRLKALNAELQQRVFDSDRQYVESMQALSELLLQDDSQSASRIDGSPAASESKFGDLVPATNSGPEATTDLPAVSGDL